MLWIFYGIMDNLWNYFFIFLWNYMVFFWKVFYGRFMEIVWKFMEIVWKLVYYKYCLNFNIKIVLFD